MKYQSLLHKKLQDGFFVFTAETTPPDASDKENLLRTIMPLKDVADAINVTDCPGAKVHMSALTASIILGLVNDFIFEICTYLNLQNNLPTFLGLKNSFFSQKSYILFSILTWL